MPTLTKHPNMNAAIFQSEFVGWNSSVAEYPTPMTTRRATASKIVNFPARLLAATILS